MSQRPRWHAALAYALLGQVPDDLPEPGELDLPRLLADLDRCHEGGLASIRAELAGRGVTRLPVEPLPDDLRVGLPAAQFAAASRALEQHLGLPAVRRVAAPRPLDADERRLQSDVPPHHGV